jgi:hypothetical protein
LANHHQGKTPPKQTAEKVMEEKSGPSSRTSAKYKTNFDNSAKMSTTNKVEKVE